MQAAQGSGWRRWRCSHSGIGGARKASTAGSQEQARQAEMLPTDGGAPGSRLDRVAAQLTGCQPTLATRHSRCKLRP